MTWQSFAVHDIRKEVDSVDASKSFYMDINGAELEFFELRPCLDGLVLTLPITFPELFSSALPQFPVSF